MVMNVMALTPLLERFESEYGTLTSLALFMGREFSSPPLLCLGLPQLTTFLLSLFHLPRRTLHPHPNLPPPHQHSRHGRLRLGLPPPRRRSHAHLPHQPLLHHRNRQHSHVDHAPHHRCRGERAHPKHEFVGSLGWSGGGVCLWAGVYEVVESAGEGTKVGRGKVEFVAAIAAVCERGCEDVWAVWGVAWGGGGGWWCGAGCCGEFTEVGTLKRAVFDTRGGVWFVLGVIYAYILSLFESILVQIAGFALPRMLGAGYNPYTYGP